MKIKNLKITYLCIFFAIFNISAATSADSSDKAKSETPLNDTFTGPPDQSMGPPVSAKIGSSVAQSTQESTSKLSDNECKSKKKRLMDMAENLLHDNSNQLKDGDMGTPEMKKCVELSQGWMRDLYKNGRPTGQVKWDDLIEISKDCMKDEGVCDKNLSARCIKKGKSQASRCDAAAYLISAFDKNWTSPEDVKTPDIKGGNPIIKCQGAGIATFDYAGCVKFVSNSQLLDVAQQTIQTGQQLYYQDKSMTEQMNVASSTNSATASLEALKSDAKSQQDMMTQRAVMDTGKLAALASYYADIPTDATLTDMCQNYKNIAVPEFKEGCTSAISSTSFGFLMNQQARDAMKAKLVKAGVDVVSDVAMAALMAQRAKDINSAIAKVDAFAPIDPFAQTANNNNLQSTFCQQNPGDAKCLTAGLDRTFDTMSDNVLTFGDGGTGTVYSNNNPNLNNGGTTTNAINPTDSTRVSGVGNVVSDSNQKGGLADSVAAATVAKGTSPTSAGGGGGAVSGGGSGGGGGGSSPSGGGGPTAAIPGKAPDYSGGTGSLSMMGGYGLNKSKAPGKIDDNPFGKLFSKDHGSSNSLDFGRSPASLKVGNKNDNLFEMISNRYSSVNANKRLIEYEAVK